MSDLQEFVWGGVVTIVGVVILLVVALLAVAVLFLPVYLFGAWGVVLDVVLVVFVIAGLDAIS